LPIVGAWIAKSDAAAWVQAIGSIVAILASFVLANYAYRREAERNREEERQSHVTKYVALFEIFNHGVAISKLGRQYLQDDDADWPNVHQEAAEVVRVLDGIPPFDLPDPRLVHIRSLVSFHLRNLRDLAELFAEAQPSRSELDRFTERFDGRVNYLESAREIAKKQATTLNPDPKFVEWMDDLPGETSGIRRGL
jgi:hypothetical protein